MRFRFCAAGSVDRYIQLAKAGVENLKRNLNPETNSDGKPWILDYYKKDLRLSVFYSEVNDSPFRRFKVPTISSILSIISLF